MSLRALNELKRRLENDSTPLPKRLRLAKNVVHSQHFTPTPKERIVADWLDKLMKSNRLSNKDVKEILTWLNNTDDLTSDLKTELIKMVSQYLHSNPVQNEDIQHIVSFLENTKMSAQLSSQVEDFLFITSTLLQHIKNDINSNLVICEKIFNNILKFYREKKKKFEFIKKLLDGENLETIFSYLDTACHDSIIKICHNILFPITKKALFASFLNNLIRKDNIDELITEKGENIRAVLKIMSAFFTFPKGRTRKDQKFLSDFISVFVSCYHTESQIIFAFYIMAASALNMPQLYLTPAMKMPPIIFEENDVKIKRTLFLIMLQVLHQNEVDISVKLTDTLGEKISKVEIKKNFTYFLQAVMMGQLKLEGKPDKITMQIIKAALKLDPTLIEQKMQQILPHLITTKKNNNVLSTYIETMNCLLEILFKLSHGMDFISQILPHIKLALEASNVEQFELKQKQVECDKNGEDYKTLKTKILTGQDLFPKDCVETYGKLTSELMFRQNKDLLISLHRDLEENCLMMLEEGFVSPSIITLAEVLSDILCSFLHHSKMADHTVPLHIAEEFWTIYQKFESECLKKFGECLLKLSYNPSLLISFLKLCLSAAELKLLNMKYSNKKLEIRSQSDQSEMFDLSLLLPCLDAKQWMNLTSKAEGDEDILILDKLLLTKTMALEILATNFDDNNLTITTIKSHLIKEIPSKPNVNISNDYYTKVLFTNLNKSQCRQLAKSLVKLRLNNLEVDTFQKQGIIDNKPLLQALVLETVRTMTKCFDNSNSLTKRLYKPDFDMSSFVKEINIESYFKSMTIDIENQKETVTNCLEILKQLEIYYLEENYQLAAIFVLLALKRCCQLKKIRRNIDYTLQSLYELSPKYPDIYKLFPVEYIFSFEDDSVIDLLTLSIKTSNTLFIVKSILESAVKKVKTDSEIINNIVQILLTKHESKCSNISSIEYFSDPVFQMNCIVLPLIAKEKKAITTSAFRSILANLQEKLNEAMLQSFKNIDFTKNKSLGSPKNYETSNIDDSIVISTNTMGILNAMGAYTLTLLKCCETTDAKEIQNLSCLWSGLDFFVQNAIQSIENTNSKNQHIEVSVHLLTVTLRYIKKLESHNIFRKKDDILLKIWQSIKSRLLLVFDDTQKKKRLSVACSDQIGITLKFLSELSSQESFAIILGDLTTLSLLKKPSIIVKNEWITNSQITSHKVAKYLWIKFLKANIVGPKCVAMSKLMYRNCKNIKTWIYTHYDDVQHNADNKVCYDDEQIKTIKVDDAVCKLLRIDLDMLLEAILTAKKIPIDSKFLDAIFEIQHLVHYILGRSSIDTRCEISWHSFFTLYEGCYGVLNSLLQSREELLEDRWPCYMQCWKPLILCLCERATSQVLDRYLEEKLAEAAHSMEKLTQAICKRKAHVSRISAYAVADLCSWLERTAPPKMVRKHLENSIALLIQASDSTYAMAFLKRALAGAAGQMTLTNMYTMYKRYHKYVGNA